MNLNLKCLTGDRMHALLGHTPARGHPELISHLRRLTQQVHLPPKFEESITMVSVGGIDAAYKVVDMVLQDGQFDIHTMYVLQVLARSEILCWWFC